MPPPIARFTSPQAPKNHARPYPDMGLDGELKENIKRRIQDVFSSTFKSARQKGGFTYEHEAKFLDWLHVVVEQTYRDEVVREHQGQHNRDDDYRTALLKEKQELTARIQRIDNIISGLVAGLPADLIAPPPSYSKPLQPPTGGGLFPAATHKPNPAPNVPFNQPTSPNVQWRENERRRVLESSNFRAIGEAIRQIESNRQRQWNDWTYNRITAPLPIVNEQEDILNRITRAAVAPPLRNTKPSAPSSAIPSNGPLVSDGPGGRQPHAEGAGGKYHSGWEQVLNATPTVWPQPQAPPMKSPEYSTSYLRCKPNKARNERTASPGYTGYGTTVEKPSYEIWHPSNMEGASAAQEAGRNYIYSRPGNTETKGKWKTSYM